MVAKTTRKKKTNEMVKQEILKSQVFLDATVDAITNPSIAVRI